MVNQKFIDEHKNNIEPAKLEPDKLLYDFLLESDTNPTFRVYNHVGEKLFGTTFAVAEWNMFVELVNRFNSRYQQKMGNKND